jgi:hypothetical protein
MQNVAESFAALTDQQLLGEVKTLAARERDATTVLILSLAELDARRLYLPLGYSSLLAYCMRELQMSKSAACSRIRAARSVRAFPAALEYLADGSITLSNLNILGPHLTTENHLALLRAAQYQTAEEVERQMAALSPGAPDIVTIHVRVHAETRERLQRAQELWGPAEGGNMAAVLDRAVTLVLQELERKQPAKVTRPRADGKEVVKSRRPPAWMRRKVFRRDGGQCAFVGTAGRCPERSDLQFHHLDPYGKRGPTRVENLQLRCGAHNRYEAELVFGAKAVRRTRARRKRNRRRAARKKGSS